MQRCILIVMSSAYKFFRKRFNLSHEEDSDDHDGLGYINKDNSRPSFSSIVKSDDFLDKVLAASGFTHKDQDEIEKFIEGKIEGKDTVSSDDEDAADKGQAHDESSDAVAIDIECLDLADQHNISKECANEDAKEGLCHYPHSTDTNKAERVDGSEEPSISYNRYERVEDHVAHCVAISNEDEASIATEGDSNSDPDEDDDDAVLVKRLNKQRRRAFVAVRSGGGKALSSRNSYKDKGGKSTHNSRVQRQLCNLAV